MSSAGMDETDFLDRVRLVAEAFRPAAPIDRRELFAGRAEQIAELFSIVSQPGQHAIVYGERGVGKTSLGLVAAELLGAADVLCAWATCDASDDFSSVWRKALGEIGLTTAKQALGFGEHVDQTTEPLSKLLASEVTPHAVQGALKQASRQRPVAIVFDEFDRFQDADGRVLFADTIKALSDRVVSSTLVLIGVADSVGELIREHRSVERALVQIQMPRMSASELAEIATNGVTAARMTITRAAVARITALSQGLPHYTHLLTQLAAQAALAERRADIGVRDVDAAVTRAIDRAQQSIVEAYREAVTGRPGTIYPQVLLACALAEEDEFGFFVSSDVREPLSKILHKPSRTSAFARHLEELSSESRGAVLQRSSGGGGAARYRFVNPLLQPYVAMRGISEGVVRVSELQPGR
ncbi:ATP-binding protein [Gaiella sp.]|uniref:ATP-binding protein n=1 Tax=Gaiella sp. TaxID=2663207 RepID=UPI002CDF8A01|nr:ATP-binding protein [Gaiella sp.]HWO79407.1 ATP-binding protein [Gaiella sp.]